jgi:hypothetical protein
MAVSVVEMLLGVFALIGGVVHLLFGVGGLVSFNGTDVALGAIANALGDLFTIEGLILLAAGVGLWMLKIWGWKLSIGINIAGIITSVAVLALGSVGAVPPLIISIVIVYYLSRRSIRDSFSAQSKPTGSAQTS